MIFIKMIANDVTEFFPLERKCFLSADEAPSVPTFLLTSAFMIEIRAITGLFPITRRLLYHL